MDASAGAESVMNKPATPYPDGPSETVPSSGRGYKNVRSTPAPGPPPNRGDASAEACRFLQGRGANGDGIMDIDEPGEAPCEGRMARPGGVDVAAIEVLRFKPAAGVGKHHGPSPAGPADGVAPIGHRQPRPDVASVEGVGVEHDDTEGPQHG